jgi:EAL domain-containing protein (putative c-di-GMP-specific phosphodiesterase class I)
VLITPPSPTPRNPSLRLAAAELPPVDGPWVLVPVCHQGDSLRLAGAVLWPRDVADPPFALENLEPAEAVAQASAATLAALALLERLLEPLWLAVPVHPRALLSARGWWRSLSRHHADLAAARERAGRRLVVTVAQADGLEQVDPALIHNLAALHTLALSLEQLRPSVLQRPLQWPLARLFVGAAACAGIDCDQHLQQQWRFLAHAAVALAVPLAALGVGTASELAWLRRHGCAEAGGPVVEAAPAPRDAV